MYESIVDLFLIPLALFGIFLIAWGAYHAVALRNNVLGILFVLAGSIAVVSFSTITVDRQQTSEKEFEELVADYLDTTPDQLVIIDLSESQGIFSPDKNPGLNEIIFEKKSYIVQVEKGEIIKFEEVEVSRIK